MRALAALLLSAGIAAACGSDPGASDGADSELDSSADAELRDAGAGTSDADALHDGDVLDDASPSDVSEDLSRDGETAPDEDAWDDAGVADADASDVRVPDANADAGADVALDADAGEADTDAASDSGDPGDAAPADTGADATTDTGTDATTDTGTDATPDADATSPCSDRGAPVETAPLRVDVLLAAALPACAPLAVPAAIPTGATWTIDATGLPADARLFVYDAIFLRTPGAPPPVRARSDRAGDDGIAELNVTSDRSGEWWVVVERDDASSQGAVELRARCDDGCGAEATRFPIVLLHGYAGVDSYFGVLDYFFDVVPTLEDEGYVAFTPVVDAIADTTDRAAQLAPQVDAILRDTGARKVNLVAHSQGGLDARYLVSTLGYADRVASITTVATPHGGIPAVLFDFFSVHDFGTEATARFNEANPDAPGVAYYSWAFRSCRALQFGCIASSNGEVVDGFLIATHTLLSRFGDNDGIVPTDNMAWGELLGLRFADHFDQVGQIADLDLPIDPFDHRAFYRDEARRLSAAGF